MANATWYEEAESLGAHPIHTERDIGAVNTSSDEPSSAKVIIDELMELRDEVLSDLSAEKNDNRRMSDISREELDAKLEATNARVEARLSSFESSIRDALAGVREDSAAVRGELAEMRGELKAIHVELGGLRNIKGSIWGAAGATIVAVIGITGAMLAYGVASFDSGRETTALIQEAKQQTSETRQLLEQIRAERIAPPATPAPPAIQPKPEG